jgi:hypothetical protein
LSTADLATSAGRGRDERVGRTADSSRPRDEADVKRSETANASPEREQTPLFPSTQAEEFKTRWTSIQSGFVDEPRRAVEQADSLIAEVMKALASSFSDERQHLEQQWDRGDDVSTEDLRLGLKRYRSFFDRLLSI